LFVIFSKIFIDLNGEQKWCRKLFKLLDYSLNQMKKIQNKEKVTLNIFKKVTTKNSMNLNTFLALTNSKIEIFSKFQKQMMI
jgi:hypothetical protein